MKILVLSDSHAALRFMRRCVEMLKPDRIIHLGDYYDDAEALHQEFVHIPMDQVAGNCDKYRAPINARAILNYPIDGVMFYMTHGHQHFVKSGLGGLLAAARQTNAQIALFGHTHQRVCYQEDDGLWVLNPGTCGYSGGSAGIVETEDGKINACYLISQADLEDMQ